jgi:hypothetical protein
MLGWGAAFDRRWKNYRDAPRAFTCALLMAHIVRPAFLRCRKPKLLSLCGSFRPNSFRALAADAWRICRGSSAHKMTADQRTGSESTLMALPCVCRRPGDRRRTSSPRTRRLLTRASGRVDPLRRWHLGVESDSGATSGRVATTKAGNPQVRAFVLVLSSTCSDHQGACGLSQVGQTSARLREASDVGGRPATPRIG